MTTNEREPLARPQRDADVYAADDVETTVIDNQPEGGGVDDVPMNADDSYLTGPAGLGTTGVYPQYDPLEDPVRRT
ncbi:MAG: hypothetical protein M3Q29_18225 [Chloroflexota bacterium]|nr:hypothetical protein [Chloroflexota bacterium]